MAIEIVDLPIENGDFPVRYVSHYKRVSRNWFKFIMETPNRKWMMTGDNYHILPLYLETTKYMCEILRAFTSLWQELIEHRM